MCAHASTDRATDRTERALLAIVSNGSARLEATLLSALSQDHDSVEVTIVDVSRSRAVDAVAGRHGVPVIRPRSGSGFAAAANALLGESLDDFDWLVFCHDEVALEPDVVRSLIEGAEEANALISGPKVRDWNKPQLLREAGFGCDRYGYHRSNVDPGEMDKGQHARLRDVFFVSTTCMAVRRDLFVALGGFDTELHSTEADLDFCWRARLVGAKVVVVPQAVVYHEPSSLDVPRGKRPAREISARNRLRVVTKCWGLRTLIVTLAAALLSDCFEIAFRAVTGRRLDLGSKLRVWAGYLLGIWGTLGKRRAVQRSRVTSDADIAALQSRGSLRVRAALERQLHHEAVASGSEAVPVLHSPGSGVGEFVLHELTRPTVVFWVSWLLFVAIVSRNLLFSRFVPVLGQLGAFDPADPPLTDFFRTWHASGVGYSGYASPALLLLGLVHFIGLQAPVAGLKLLLVVSYVCGSAGVWSLVRQISAPRWEGAAVATVAYSLSAPVVASYEVGSLAGVVAVGLAPWIVGYAFRTLVDPRRTLGFVALLALLVYLVSAFEPLQIATVAAVVFAATVLASLLAGRFRRSLWTCFLTLIACAAAGALSWVWLGQGGRESLLDSILAGWDGGRVMLGVGGVVRMQSTSLGQPPLGYALAVLAGVALVVSSGERLRWSIRLLFGAVPPLVAIWAVGQRLVPTVVDAVPPVMVFSAVCLAASTGLGLDSLRERLPVRRGGTELGDVTDERKYPRVASLTSWALIAGVALGSVQAFVRLSAGNLGVRPTGFDRSLSEARALEERGAVSVLWLGPKEAIPGAARPLPRGMGGAYSVTGALPSPVGTRIQPISEEFEAELADALERLATPGFARGGKLLSRLGVRYVALPDPPGSYPVGSLPPPPEISEALARQLDVVEVKTVRGMRLFRIADEAAVWTASSVDAAVAKEPLDAGEVGIRSWLEAELTAVAPALRPATIRGSGAVEPPANAGLLLFKSYDPGLRLEVRRGDGPVSEVAPVRALGWATYFDISDVAGRQRAHVTLGYEQEPGEKWPPWLQVAGVVCLFVLALLFRKRQEEIELPERLAAYGDTAQLLAVPGSLEGAEDARSDGDGSNVDSPHGDRDVGIPPQNDPVSSDRANGIAVETPDTPPRADRGSPIE